VISRAQKSFCDFVAIGKLFAPCGLGLELWDHIITLTSCARIKDMYELICLAHDQFKYIFIVF